MFTDLHTMANAELSALAVAVSIEAARIRADEAAVEYEFQRRTSEARLVETTARLNALTLRKAKDGAA